MTGKLFWHVLLFIWFVLALSDCSGRQASDSEYLLKSAKAVVFFSTSSESLFRNLSTDPKEAKSDSLEHYSQLLLNNFMAVRSLETFKNHIAKLNRTALNLIQDVANPPGKYTQLHKQVLAMYYEYKDFTGHIGEARLQTEKQEIFKNLDAAISTMFKLKKSRENLEAQFPTEIYKKALDAETKQHQDLIDAIKKLKR